MARIGGRSTWFAWLVGLVCFGVVGALVFLAVPLAPAIVDWSGSALRGDLDRPRASADPVPDADGGADAQPERPAAPGECRELYSEQLWALLSTASGVELSEGADPAPTTITALADELSPSVLLSCSWSTGSGVSVSSVLAEVATDASDAAARTLAGAGFACSPFGLGIRCEGPSGAASADVAEIHTIRDGLWLATIERGWRPPDYAATVEASVWAR